MYCLAIFSIALMIGGTQACSCFYQTPADRYCKADYVISATVLEEDRVSNLPQDNGNSSIIFTISNSPVTYTLNVSKIYRNKDEHVELGGNILKSASNSAACGVALQKNEDYILAGNYRFDNDKFDSLYLVSCGSIVIKLPPQNDDLEKVASDIRNGVFDSQCSSTKPTPLLVPSA